MRQQRHHRKVLNAPSLRPFDAGHGQEQELRIDAVGRALDDVVGTFVAMADGGALADGADLRRFVAATRRLWTLALRLYRTHNRCR